MNRKTTRLIRTLKGLVIAAALGAVHSTSGSRADEISQSPALVDDFSDAQRSSSGTDRMLVNDKDVGGQSTATQEHANGVLKVAGSLLPARGMPAWISLVIPTPQEDGTPRDLSRYEGVRVRLRITRGMLTVQACSSEVQNFDYHVSAPLSRNGDDFHEMRLPFREMKRNFSEQTPLNLKTIVAINLVAAGMAKGEFAYEVDEISLY